MKCKYTWQARHGEKYLFLKREFIFTRDLVKKHLRPRNWISVYARAFLFTKLGRKSEAISMWNLIIKSLSNDYGIRTGESVD